MDTVTNGPQKEEFRLSAEQQAEIGDFCCLRAPSPGR